MIVSYYTQMDRAGELTVHFEINVLDFIKPPEQKNNPRICLGLRERVNDTEVEVCRAVLDANGDPEFYSNGTQKINCAMEW